MSGDTGRQVIKWNPNEYIWDPFQLVAGTDFSTEVLRYEVPNGNFFNYQANLLE
jgi:hypothetical protein